MKYQLCDRLQAAVITIKPTDNNRYVKSLDLSEIHLIEILPPEVIIYKRMKKMFAKMYRNDKISVTKYTYLAKKGKHVDDLDERS